MPPPDKRDQYWPSFLKQLGERILWEQCATNDTKRSWLNDFEEFTSPGFKLFNFAQRDPQQLRGPEPTILLNDLERICFQADFYNGESRQTIYLSDCKPDLLTVDEKRLSPSFVAQEEERRRDEVEIEAAKARNISKAAAVSVQLNAAAKEAAKATEIVSLLSNPSIADAKNAAIKKGVPEEFVAHCLTEFHVNKFPSTGQAHKAVQTEPLFRALRDPDAPSRSTVGRWLRSLRLELEKRGQLQPRVKLTPAQKAAHYNMENHPMPKLNEAEKEQEQGGRTDCDIATSSRSFTNSRHRKCYATGLT